ncbi:MAG: GNAT family N-acetyltransferase [Gordonia sp. (in: high G+C Gram-positive bacteria)]
MTLGVQLHREWTADLDAATFYEILRLRVEVFVVEQSCPYPELDGRDLEPTTRQLWVSDADGAVIATLRLLEDGASEEYPMFRIGRVCTARSHRGHGYAARLIATALAEVGKHPCRIEAQSYLTGMYAQFGFVIDGDEYLEDGIPHVSMLRPGAISNDAGSV